MSAADGLGLSIGYGKHLWEIRAVTITRANLLVSPSDLQITVLDVKQRMNQLSPSRWACETFGSGCLPSLLQRHDSVEATYLVHHCFIFRILRNRDFSSDAMHQAGQLQNIFVLHRDVERCHRTSCDKRIPGLLRSGHTIAAISAATILQMAVKLGDAVDQCTCRVCP